MKPVPKKESIRRLRIIEGHVRKIRKMVEDEEYCPNILQQTSAVSAAIRKVDEMILDSHLYTCVVPSFKSGDAKKSVKELVEVFKRR